MATEKPSVEIDRLSPKEREREISSPIPTPAAETERTYPMYPLRRMMVPGTGAILAPTEDSLFFANKKERLSLLDRGLAADAKAPRAKRGEIKAKKEAEEEGEGDNNVAAETEETGTEESATSTTVTRRGRRGRTT